MDVRKSLDDRNRPATARTTELLQTADKMASFHRISWKEAFVRIAAPAFRLHRYRTAHNRLLQDALCELDCTDSRRS